VGALLRAALEICKAAGAVSSGGKNRSLKISPALRASKKEEGRDRTRASSSILTYSGQSGWAVHKGAAIAII
jgi:hypothetical protein